MIRLKPWIFLRQNSGEWHSQTIGGRISILINRQKHSDGCDYFWSVTVNWGDGNSISGSCKTVSDAKLVSRKAVDGIYERLIEDRRERVS